MIASTKSETWRTPTGRRWLKLLLAILPLAGFIVVFVSRLPILVRVVLFAASWLTPLLMSRLSPTMFKTPKPRVQIDTHGVQRLLGADVMEQVRWENLVKVSIVTTDDGPLVEDFFWLLHAADGTGCMVPHESACEVDLLSVLQMLPRFDNMAAIEACGSTSPREFVCWEGTPGEGLAAGAAMQEKAG